MGPRTLVRSPYTLRLHPLASLPMQDSSSEDLRRNLVVVVVAITTYLLASHYEPTKAPR